MKLVIFEGVHKSGKSSLLKQFNILTNYKHTVVERAWVSQLAYAVKNKRLLEKEDTLNMMSKLKDDLIIVYCRPATDIIRQRLLSIQRDYIDIDTELKIFDDIIHSMRNLGFNIITLNTNVTKGPLVGKILSYIEELK